MWHLSLRRPVILWSFRIIKCTPKRAFELKNIDVWWSEWTNDCICTTVVNSLFIRPCVLLCLTWCLHIHSYEPLKRRCPFEAVTDLNNTFSALARWYDKNDLLTSGENSESTGGQQLVIDEYTIIDRYVSVNHFCIENHGASWINTMTSLGLHLSVWRLWRDGPSCF